MRIFGLKTDEVVGGWRKLHNEELYNLHISPVIMIESRRVRLARHIACMGENRISWESKKEGDH
jgi:hypothetical protein